MRSALIKVSILQKRIQREWALLCVDASMIVFTRHAIMTKTVERNKVWAVKQSSPGKVPSQSSNKGNRCTLEGYRGKL